MLVAVEQDGLLLLLLLLLFYDDAEFNNKLSKSSEIPRSADSTVASGCGAMYYG